MADWASFAAVGNPDGCRRLAAGIMLLRNPRSQRRDFEHPATIHAISPKRTAAMESVEGALAVTYSMTSTKPALLSTPHSESSSVGQHRGHGHEDRAGRKWRCNRGGAPDPKGDPNH
jgi:hypothetical protein